MIIMETTTKKKTKFKQTEIGMIPEGWEVKKLGEVANFKTGKLDSNYAQENGQFPFFTCAPKPLKINSYSFDCEAILIAGNNANGIFHTNYYNGKFDAYQRTYVITSKSNATFLKYLLYQLNFRLNYLKEISQGTATKFLTIVILNNLDIPIPHTEEQRAIAKILSDLDNKIELLQAQNKTLEAMGQALFKHWFVDYEFPNEKGKPYKSNGGKMVDSELGKIPEGWEVGKLNDLGKIITGKTPSTFHKEYYGGDILFLKIPDMTSIYPMETILTLTNEGLQQVKNLVLPEDSLSVSCIGTLGLISINKKPLVTNQNINSIIFDNKKYLYYVYYDAKIRYTTILESFGGGSVFGTVSKSKFSEIKLIMPSYDIVLIFDKIMKTIFERIYINLLEIRNLSDVRDLLLPKLMSGKIRVHMEAAK